MLLTFVALVQDKSGVLTRVVRLFRRLNINIVSFTLGESERAGTSRMTMLGTKSQASPKLAFVSKGIRSLAGLNSAW